MNKNEDNCNIGPDFFKKKKNSFLESRGHRYPFSLLKLNSAVSNSHSRVADHPLSQNPPPFVPFLIFSSSIGLFLSHSSLSIPFSPVGPLQRAAVSIFSRPREIPYSVSSTLSDLVITTFRNADRRHPFLKTVATCSLRSGSYHAGNRQSALFQTPSFAGPAVPALLHIFWAPPLASSLIVSALTDTISQDPPHLWAALL